MLSLYIFFITVPPCCGYMLSRAVVDGVPSDLVTIVLADDVYPQQIEILTNPADWVVK